MGTGGSLNNRQKQRLVWKNATSHSKTAKNPLKPRRGPGRGPLAPHLSSDEDSLNKCSGTSHFSPSLEKFRKFTEEENTDALIDSLTDNSLLKSEDYFESEDEYAKAEAETSRGIRPKSKPSKRVGGKHVSDPKSKDKGKGVSFNL
jgi:hypothetical protein